MDDILAFPSDLPSGGWSWTHGMGLLTVQLEHYCIGQNLEDFTVVIPLNGVYIQYIWNAVFENLKQRFSVTVFRPTSIEVWHLSHLQASALVLEMDGVMVEGEGKLLLLF